MLNNNLKISIAQTNTVLADVDKNLAKHLELINKAIDKKNDVVFFPELSLTGYSLKDAVYDVALKSNDAKFDKIKELSKKIGIIFGMVELDQRFELYNTLLYFQDGELLNKHRKVYLPTYGLFEEKRYFSEGNRFRAFTTKYGRIGMLICEDMWHPTSGIILAQDGASIIFVSSAGIARGMVDEEKPENVRVWESLNRSLAISTTSYIVFANRVGIEDGLVFWGGSEALGPSGETVCKAQYFNEDQVEAELDLLKLKHARITTTLIGDEKIDIVLDELKRIKKLRKEY
jgi:NAD+ synthase (glutamine-hydrolysing)